MGALESIVQAAPEDKKARPGCWRTYSYELALVTQAVVDEDASPEAPAGTSAPQRYEQGAPPAEGERWRCAACYQTRFKTMCFGENAPPAARECKFCGRTQSEVGWTIWRRYDELPGSARGRVDRANGPKILSTLRTRWPEVEIAMLDGAGREVPLGGEAFAASGLTAPAA